MTRLEYELRHGLHELGETAQPRDMLSRSLRSARDLRRRRGISAALATAVVVAGISAGVALVVGQPRQGSVQPLHLPSTSSAPSSPAVSPPASIPGASRPANSPSTPASPSPGASSATQVVDATLDIVYCPTSYGGGEPTAFPSATTEQLPIPQELVGQLAVYRAHDVSLGEVVAPRGWKCAAGMSADGGEGIDVVPPQMAMALLEPATTPDAAANDLTGWDKAAAAQGISWLDTGACVGCADGLACPFGISAAGLDGYSCGSLPAGYATTKVSSDVVDYVVAASATSRYTTVGRIVYVPKSVSTHVHTTRIACTLPPDRRAVCTTNMKLWSSSNANGS